MVSATSAVNMKMEQTLFLKFQWPSQISSELHKDRFEKSCFGDSDNIDA